MADKEKMVPVMIRAYPSVMKAVTIAAVSAGVSRKDFIHAALLAAIPPAFSKGLPKK